METKVLKVENLKEDYNNIIEAAEIIKNGEIVAIPTETVYGLASSMYNEEAIKKIFIAKGRPQDNPLIAHISSIEQINDICKEFPEEAKKLTDKFWPGPLTIILKRKRIVPDIVTAGLETVAVRFPSNKIANAVIKEARTPLVVPSANLSGKPSTTSANHCINDLKGRIPLIIDGGECELGLESTIIDASTKPMVLVREGAISIEDILKIIPDLIYERTVNSEDIKKTPGMKYKHYTPNAQATLIIGNPEKTAEWIAKNAKKEDGIICFDEYIEKFKDSRLVLNFGSYQDIETNASRLFSLLREFDKIEVKRILIQCPQNKGIGKSIINRLEKASGGNIINIDK